MPVKRTTDNLNLRSEICDIASAWLHDLHSRETKSCWKQIWTIIFDFKLCITLQHPNDLAVFLQHSPLLKSWDIIIYTAQCAAILPHHLRKLIIRFCGPIGRKMKQRNNTIYGFWTCPEVKTVDAFIIVWWEKAAKWLVARVHKLTCINAVHWASQEKLAG